MPSTFTWIDDSDEQRRKVLDAIDVFRERDTRDELGLAVIRDAFSDLLFPGTGAVQTRARYFFFVPWVYRDLERQRVPSGEIARHARQKEVALIAALLRAQDSEGTIGRLAGAALKRLPSSIYWAGLGRLGIRRFTGSQDDYHRSLDGWYRRLASTPKTDDGEPADRVAPNWHAGLPGPPDGFPSRTDFALSRAEAHYLMDCIASAAPRSLLAALLEHLDEEMDWAFAWEHPLAQKLARAHDNTSRELTRELTHARWFSESLHGAAILYNLILAKQVPKRSDLVEANEQRFLTWSDSIQQRRDALLAWDRQDFWAVVRATHARVSPLTQRFIEAWLHLALDQGDARQLIDSPDARTLIKHREKLLKGALARIDNARALELWQGESGLGQMDFRWRNAQRILNDIALALKGHSRA